jgi:hypothetical protein
MRYGLIADDATEQQLIDRGQLPVAQLDTFVPLIQARAVMAAVRVGLFAALRDAPRNATELAAGCKLDAETTELVLRVLADTGHVTATADRCFALTDLTRRELLDDSPQRVTAWVALHEMWWDRFAGIDTLLCTGVGVDLHHQLSDAEWSAYQAAMLANARRNAPFVAPRVPVPAGATRLLDIAGSHGLYGALIARAHQPLRSEVLDLPEAIEHARALGHDEGIDDVVSYRAGNALTDHLGNGLDAVFIGNLVHHLSPASATDLLRRVRAALVRGGTVTIMDSPQPDLDDHRHDAITDTYGLFFRLTSTARCYSIDELTTWLDDAGFTNISADVPGALLVLATGHA